jgi:pimeloyl-ACP methyl ester carboxylesterase
MDLSAVPLRRIEIHCGIEIHYVEAGTGSPLVFVHGGMGDWQSWAPQWPAFAPHFRCFSYSRRFSSPNRNRLDRKDHLVFAEADDLSALIDAWEAAPAILVGTSYGAYTALALALHAPDKVRALVLTEPPVLPFADRVSGGRAAREHFEREVLRPSDAAFASGQTELAIGILTGGINGADSQEAMSATGLAKRLRNSEAMRALALSDNAYPALDLRALAALKVPTLLMRGANTEAVHRATFESLAELMPRAETAEVRDAGHGVHRDNPGLFNEIVLHFLCEIGSNQAPRSPV